MNIVSSNTYAILISLFVSPVLGICQTNDGDKGMVSSAEAEFFESRIRPLLISQCLDCHGNETAEAELRLDSRQSILRTDGNRKPVVVPGDPGNSLIIRAVGYESDLKMPPHGRLNDTQIADLTAWVKMGLPWPENHQAVTTESMKEKIERDRKSHWSFQPIERPRLPELQNDASAPLIVDQLILAKLESAGLEFSPPADRRTLIRRATFDLIGLPPTNEQVEQFIDNDDSQAYRKLVDRLLESPQYGERWARHWLDVARYADTRGYTFDNADRNYPFAFTYRDYVIDAFNNDLPFDQFIREQLAADYLDATDDGSRLAALGFLTVGRKFIVRSDTVDDQVDVVTRGLLGLTVSCARCHDHKYDAIPTDDYYSLYGIFENCHEPDELPLIGEPPKDDEAVEFLEKLAELEQKVVDFGDTYHQKLQEQMDKYLTDYLVRAIAPDVNNATSLEQVQLERSELNEHAISDWQLYLAALANGNHPAVMPVKALFELPPDGFAENSRKLVEYWKSSKDLTVGNQIVIDAFVSAPPNTKAEMAVTYSELLQEIRQQWLSNGGVQPALDQFKGLERELATVILSKDSAAQIPRSRIHEYFNIEDGKKFGKLKSAVSEFHLKSPVSIRRAMTIRENQPAHNSRIMIRGNEQQLGAEVPRQFLEVLTLGERNPFTNGAGRLELANAIVDRKNPLTARILVNRIWMHHFSKPLVDTPNDFGTRCPKPVQAELLDFLACELMDNHWSIKHLHRIIMTSRAYCQQSGDRVEPKEVDPDNRLIWKMNRRRLEFEAVRDSMLAVCGNLESSLYGPAGELFQEPWATRRTIYGKIDRQDLPNILRIFDIANPDQSADKRIRTMVPQQSLFMMNNDFSTSQSRLLAARVPFEGSNSLSNKQSIQKIYEIVFQRRPTERETKLGMEFLPANHDPDESDNLSAWERYAQALLCSNEFVFID